MPGHGRVRWMRWGDWLSCMRAGDDGYVDCMMESGRYMGRDAAVSGVMQRDDRVPWIMRETGGLR